MAEDLQHKLRHTVVCGGALIDVRVEWEDSRSLIVEQFRALE